MTDPMERFPSASPVECLSHAVDRRRTELEFLQAHFAQAMEVVEYLTQVNAVLAASSRPELVIAERAEMMPVPTFEEIGKINNFIPNMESFGIPVYEEEEDWSKPGEMKPRRVGYREFTDEEREQLFLLGGRGFEEIEELAEQLGVEKDLKRAAQNNTNAGREAFIRMWILFPELTEAMMTSCLTRAYQRHKRKDEEIFIAYNIMAKLVDMDDSAVRKDDGTIDDRRLCR